MALLGRIPSRRLLLTPCLATTISQKREIEQQNVARPIDCTAIDTATPASGVLTDREASRGKLTASQDEDEIVGMAGPARIPPMNGRAGGKLPSGNTVSSFPSRNSAEAIR